MLHRFTNTEAHKIGAGGSLLADVQVQVLPTPQSTPAGGRIPIQVRVTSAWGYQFSEEQLHSLATLIAGTSTQQASALLLGQPVV